MLVMTEMKKASSYVAVVVAGSIGSVAVAAIAVVVAASNA